MINFRTVVIPFVAVEQSNKVMGLDRGQWDSQPGTAYALYLGHGFMHGFFTVLHNYTHHKITSGSFDDKR